MIIKWKQIQRQSEWASIKPSTSLQELILQLEVKEQAVNTDLLLPDDSSIQVAHSNAHH